MQKNTGEKYHLKDHNGKAGITRKDQKHGLDLAVQKSLKEDQRYEPADLGNGSTICEVFSPPMLYANSILRKTGQWPKFLLSLALFFLGGIVMLLSLTNGSNESPELFAAMTMSGAALAMLGFVLGCTTIRCRKCGIRLFWYAVSRQSAQNWLLWLLNESSCPRCSFGASGDSRE